MATPDAENELAGAVQGAWHRFLDRSLRRLDLIDEYRLIVHPVVLGAGTPMFVDVAAHFRLQPLRSKRFESGVTMQAYGVAGR